MHVLLCFLWYIHIHVCIEYVHDWQIHSSNVNEISIIYTKSHNIEMMLHLILMKHTRTLF